MSQVAILLWVAATAASEQAVSLRPVPSTTAPEPTFAYTNAPNQQQRSALLAWARSRQLSLVPPVPNKTSALRSYESSVVERIEELLEQARLSAGSLDEALALEQLEAAATLVYQHAELPQAAYLLAESLSQQASILERRGLVRLAEIQRLRATTLEGVRARPYSTTPEVQTTTSGSPKLAKQNISVRGLKTSDVLQWDGRLEPERRFDTMVGEHHVRVLREGVLGWADFLMVHADTSQVELTLAPATPCSLSDLTTVHVTANRIQSDEPVGCPLWVLARPTTGSGVEVALCRYADCGPWLAWQQGFGEPLLPPLHEAHPFRLPRWTTYLAAGLGAAALASIVLWQSGVFDEPEPGPTTFSFGGVDQ